MREWPFRVMVYGAGEAIDGGGALSPQIQTQLARLARVSTNRYVAATAQLDSSSLPARRFVLDPLGRMPVREIANINVGDPRELVSFVSWSAETCPAQRSILVLSGHGAAWQDAMVEKMLGAVGLTRSPTAVARVPGATHHARTLFGSNANSLGAMTRAVLIDGHDRDYLSNAELGAACARIGRTLGGPIDVLVFDACLMSAWELLHELSDSVSTVVASIDELSAAGIDMAAPAQELTAALGAADAATVAASIARHFSPQTAFDSCVAIDLAGPQWAAAAARFQSFAAAFVPWLGENAGNRLVARGALRAAASSLVQFSGGGLADVGALADAIASIPQAPSRAISEVRSAAAALAECILSHSAGRDYQASTGVSLFAPNSLSVYESNRPDYARLRFPNETGWLAVLDAMYELPATATRAPRTTSGLLPSLATSNSDDAEFVVVLRGFAIDESTRMRIEKTIRRTLLERLAEVDALGDVTVTNGSAVFAALRRSLPRGTSTLGLVVDSNARHDA